MYHVPLTGLASEDLRNRLKWKSNFGRPDRKNTTMCIVNLR